MHRGPGQPVTFPGIFPFKRWEQQWEQWMGRPGSSPSSHLHMLWGLREVTSLLRASVSSQREKCQGWAGQLLRPLGNSLA